MVISSTTGEQGHTPVTSSNIRRLTLQLTRFCNLNCYYCYCHPLHGAVPQGLELAPLLEFLGNALPYSSGSITLTGGEPLIYTAIDPLLEYLGQAEQRVALETNGSYLSAERLSLLNVAGAHIAITLESVIPETHDRIRGKEGSWDDSVDALRRAAHFSKLTTQITFNLTPRSRSEILSVVSLGKDLGVSRIKLNPIYKIGPRGKTSSNARYLTIEDLLTITRIWANDISQKSKFPVDLSLPPSLLPDPQRFEARQCNGCDLGGILGVMYDGSIRPCHNFLFDGKNSLLGSIYEAYSIPDILHRLRLLPGTSVSKLEGICSRCSLVFRCRGFCRAQANIDLGSTSSATKICQDMYDLGLFPNELLVPALLQ